MLGRLKSFGSTVLDALTVPGAVAVTAVNAATGGDVSLRDLGGAFTNKDGKGAGYKLLKRFGASDRVARIAGLAPEILLDPTTYLSGGLSATAKIAGTGGKLVSRADKLAELRSLEQAAKAIIGGGGSKAVLKVEGLKVPAGLKPEAKAALLDVSRKANAVRRELETMGGVPTIRLGFGRKTIDVARGHDAGLALGTTAVRVPRGVELKLGRSARFTRDMNKGGPLRLSPAQKEFARNKRAVEDLAAVGDAIQTAAIAAHGITGAELALVKNYVGLQAEGLRGKALKSGLKKGEVAEQFKADLVERGLWRPEMDALAETYRTIDTSAARVAGLKTYADQLTAFGEVTAKASQDAKALEAAKDAEIQAARAAAGSARTAAVSARTAAAEQTVADVGPALDEVKAAIATTKDPETLAGLRKQRDKLARRYNAAAKITAGVAPARVTRRIDERLAKTVASIEARHAAQVPEVWNDAAIRFAEQARREGYAKTWGVGGKGVPEFRALEEVAGKLATHDGHFSQGLSPEMMKSISEYRAAHLAEGVTEPRLRMAWDARGMDPKLERKFTSPINWQIRTRFVEDAVKEGIPNEVAVRMANFWEKTGAKFADTPQFFPKTKVELVPDQDFFRVQRKGQAVQDLKGLEDYTTRMLKENFPEATDEAIRGMKMDIAGQWDQLATSLPTSVRNVFVAKRGAAAGESRFAIYTTWLKLWYTAFNPVGHYVLNATGSLLNSFFEGNRYHLSRGFIGAFGFNTKKLGQMKPAEMERVWKVGDGSMTGLEVLLLSSISGLGAPYAKGEIASVVNLINDTKEPPHRWLAKHLNQFQMDRENGDRLYSFLNHIRGGDDVFTAGSKVVRYSFDYSELTAFEKVHLRNILIFYTWFRKNLTFQGYGLLVRPGVHATMAKVEEARPKAPGEPEWWSKAGGIGTPMGLLTFGNPYADIFKYSADLGDARRTVLASLNPFIKLPMEIGLNRNAFTNAPVGESAVERLKHIGKSIEGPQGKLVRAIVSDKPPAAKTVDVLGRFLGPKIQPTDVAGNAGRYAKANPRAKQNRSEAAKKAAATRKRKQLERYVQETGVRP